MMNNIDIKENQGKEVPQGTSTEDLAARLSEVEGISEDAATVIAENWKKGVALLILSMFAVVGVKYYKQGLSAKEDKLASYFATAQAAFIDIKEGGDAAEKAKVLMSEQFRAIKDAGINEAYTKLEPIYRAAVGFNEGKYEEAKKELSAFKLNPQASDADALVNELGVLNHAKVLIAEGNKDQAISELRALSSDARFVNIEALLAHANLAETEEEKAALIAQAKKVSESRPEFSSVITQELRNLGYKIEE